MTVNNLNTTKIVQNLFVEILSANFVKVFSNSILKKLVIAFFSKAVFTAPSLSPRAAHWAIAEFFPTEYLFNKPFCEEFTPKNIADLKKNYFLLWKRPRFLTQKVIKQVGHIETGSIGIRLNWNGWYVKADFASIGVRYFKGIVIIRATTNCKLNQIFVKEFHCKSTITFTANLVSLILQHCSSKAT